MELKDRLKKARKSSGRTQADVSEAIEGLSQPSYSALERGESKSTSKIAELSQLFNVNPIWLATGQGDEKTNSQKQAEQFVSGLKGAITHEDAELLGREGIHIPIYDVKFCCGDGTGSFEFEELKKTLPFDKTFFERRGVKPENVKLIYVTGDSMENWLQDGDTAAIHTLETTPKDGEAYALFLDGDRMIKRIYREAGNTLILASDNKAYRDKVVTEENGESLIIIGRVFYRSG